MTPEKFIFIVSLSLLTTAFFSCNHEEALTPPSNYNHPREYSYIDTIKKYSHPRIAHFRIDLNTRDSLTLIDRSLVKRYLSSDQTYYDYSSELELTNYSNYYFFDYQNFKTWVSFSVLADTESGFMELFQYSYVKATGSVTSCSRIAIYEADGGATQNDILEYSPSKKNLTVRSHYYFDEYIFSDDQFDGCFSRLSDSTISRMKLSPNETTLSIDTIYSKIDTICN